MIKTTLQTIHGPVYLVDESLPWITTVAHGVHVYFDPVSIQPLGDYLSLYFRKGAVDLDFHSESAASAALSQIRQVLPHIPVDAPQPDIFEELRQIERRAEFAGFALPVKQFIEERVLEIARDASRELERLGLSAAASAQADAAATDCWGAG